MDWLEFIARSEWPVVVGGTLFLLHRELRGLVSQISPTKLDAFGIKAEFERKLERVELLSGDDKEVSPNLLAQTDTEDAEETLQATTASRGLVGHDQAEWVRRHISRYGNSPEMAVLKAWERIERGIRVTASMAGMNVSSRQRLGEPLLRKVGLGPDEVTIFRELRALRNSVAQANGPTSLTWDEATRFVDAIGRLYEAAQIGLEKQKTNQ